MARVAIWTLGLLAVAVATASAQTITGVTALPNAGNSPNEFSGISANPSYQRESVLAVTAATSTSF